MKKHFDLSKVKSKITQKKKSFAYKTFYSRTLTEAMHRLFNLFDAKPITLHPNPSERTNN